jgi:hypothetical protein
VTRTHALELLVIAGYVRELSTLMSSGDNDGGLPLVR